MRPTASAASIRFSSSGCTPSLRARSREPLEALVDRHGAGVVMPVVADFASDDAVDALRARLDRPVAMVVHAPGEPVAGGIRAAPTDDLVAACHITVGGFVRLVRAVEALMHRSSRPAASVGPYGFAPTNRKGRG